MGPISTINIETEHSFDVGIRDLAKKATRQDLLAYVFEQIDSLYKFSSLLRRPAIHEKYIRSLSAGVPMSHFVPWDRDHIENKFPGANEEIIRRLSLANTRRRQQLRFWEQNHESAVRESSPSFLLQSAARDTGPQSILDTTNFTSAQETSTHPRSTGQSFSTFVSSAINREGTPSAYTRTIYTPSTQAESRGLRVPDLPVVPLDQTVFECPYCHSQLKLQEMLQRHSWK